MLKKILLFICLFTTILINLNNLSAKTLILIPLKKPTLTNEEIKNKININILKPIKKPKKTQNIKVEKKKINKLKIEEKISYKIPVKKPTIKGVQKSNIVKISKHYSKKSKR